MSEAAGLSEALSRLEVVTQELSKLQQHPREYLGVEATAEFLGLSKVQLDEWRSRNTGGPAFHKVGRRVVYAISDLRAVMAANRKEPLA